MFLLKRKHKHEEHVDESWLIPYADILTLLLALFIVLFAASEVDAQKFQDISNSFNNELQGGTGVLQHQAAIETFQERSRIAKMTEMGPSKEKPTITTVEQDQIELAALQEKIENYIQEKGLSPKLQTVITSKGLLLKIKDGVLYQPGSANITNESRTIAKEISNLLVTDPPRSIVIDGHTDNVPTYSKEFPTNWELSAVRAINFMKILLENKKLDPRDFSATGYGEYHPVASNTTNIGKAENRRVEVLISTYKEHN